MPRRTGGRRVHFHPHGVRAGGIVDDRLVRSLLLLAAVALVLPGCSSPLPASVQASPPAQPATPTTYAVTGYELGAPPAQGTPTGCPSEVANWERSIVSPGTQVSVSARGPVSLTVRIVRTDGTTDIQASSIDGSHAQTFIESPSTQPDNVQRVELTATAGGQGIAGSCQVEPAATTGSENAYCQSKQWPQRIPADVIDLDYQDATIASRELGCFNITTAKSTLDGHDVGDERVPNIGSYTIVSVRPSVGTAVMLDTPVTLRVRPTRHSNS